MAKHWTDKTDAEAPKPSLDSFIREIASLTKDGETSDDGKPFVMEGDDAYDTLNGLISHARWLLHHLDTPSADGEPATWEDEGQIEHARNCRQPTCGGECLTPAQRDALMREP